MSTTTTDVPLVTETERQQTYRLMERSSRSSGERSTHARTLSPEMGSTTQQRTRVFLPTAILPGEACYRIVDYPAMVM